MTKTDRHRSALACMAGGNHAGSCFRWRCFPRVPAIAGCIRDGLGMCHLVIGQCGHLWFLYVLGSCWTTCQAPVVPRVYFLLAHVLCCGQVTCHIFTGPCVIFLLVHMTVSYQITCHGAIHPCFVFFIQPHGLTASFHVSDFYYPTCRAMAISRVMHWFIHMSQFYLIMWPVQVLSHA